MSNRVRINLETLIKVSDFSMTRWDNSLKSAQEKFQISYIDFYNTHYSEQLFEELRPFLSAAEFLGITCTFWFNHPNELEYIKTIPHFHRAGLDCNNSKILAEVFKFTHYESEHQRILLRIDSQIAQENLKYLNQFSSFIQLKDFFDFEAETIEFAVQYFIPTSFKKICNNAYQSRWPLESNRINQNASNLFISYISKAKFKSLRVVNHYKKRHRNKFLKDLWKNTFFKFEKVLRTILFNPPAVKFLRKIEKNYTLKNLFPLLTQHQPNVEKIINTQSQLKKISSSEYTIQNCYFDKMNGSIEWRSIFFNFKKSTVLTSTKKPFLIKAQFSGTARLIGFYIHQSQLIVCEAIQETHDLCLYIDKNGTYTLIRDGKVVKAVLSKSFFTPSRITAPSPLGLAAKSILGSLITQQIRYWNTDILLKNRNNTDYSIVVVCTRFSRRLEQLLKSICTQNYPINKLQVLVCYVPGIDGTDDLLDTLQLAYPEISIERLPFHESKQHHKGFMINQAALRAKGKKILLTDADIILPPNLFKILKGQYSENGFVGAYARKMLSPKTTAKILLNEINPKTEYNEVIEIDPGELRIDEAKGRPVGFFQLVKTEYLKKNPYQELPNFEGADAFFAEDISANCEKPIIAKEIQLLHLDHGGSQWYGTKRHM